MANTQKHFQNLRQNLSFVLHPGPSRFESPVVQRKDAMSEMEGGTGEIVNCAFALNGDVCREPRFVGVCAS